MSQRVRRASQRANASEAAPYATCSAVRVRSKEHSSIAVPILRARDGVGAQACVGGEHHAPAVAALLHGVARGGERGQPRELTVHRDKVLLKLRRPKAAPVAFAVRARVRPMHCAICRHESRALQQLVPVSPRQSLSLF